MSRLGDLKRLQSFPRAPAPNNDPAAVKTNLTEDAVCLLQNILAYHVAHYPSSKVFGHEQGQGLKLVEAFVRSRGDGQDGHKAESCLEAVTVCELVVEDSKSFGYDCLHVVRSLAVLNSKICVERHVERSRDFRRCLCGAHGGHVSALYPLCK